MIIYLAGPLFTLAEREFNTRLANDLNNIRPDITIILPQNEALKFTNSENMLSDIFKDCIQSVDRADVVVVILEGSDADSGTCVELGYAYGKGKPILGIRTDSRISEVSGLNLMIPFACNEMYLNTKASIEDISNKIVEFITRWENDEVNPENI